MKQTEQGTQQGVRVAGTSGTTGLILLLVVGGCADPPTRSALSPDEPGGMSCIIPEDELLDGGGGSGIFALIDPELVSAESPSASYVAEDDRVVGILLDGKPVAVPLNILWWHEIVNLGANGDAVAVTHCPLTGSSLTFDRSVVDGAAFQVSGLLFRNNLVLYDEGEGGSFWPQMLRQAACGADVGRSLPMYPSIEMTWAGWKDLYPDTRVISRETGFGREYERYPFGRYREWSNSDVLFHMGPLDPRRPPKEPVLGIPVSDGGWAFPFGDLERHERLVIDNNVRGQPVVILWDRAARGAAAYFARVDDNRTSFTVSADGFRDDETGSTWRVDGVAESGPMAGTRLDPVPEAYVAFWFAWAEFQPETVLVRF